MSNKIKVGIVGGTGYTGIELIRLLLNHPNVEITAVSSRKLKDEKLSSLFPSLIGLTNLTFCDVDDVSLTKCAIIFFATPHGVAMNSVTKFLDKSIKIIDLGADFRIKDKEVFAKYYAMKHTQTEVLNQAVYGLCELYRDDIKKAQIVANPGCYPTAVQLALAPLIKEKCINLETIIADCKSGISGAGRNATMSLIQAESVENIKAYAVSGHRHLPEIEQGLSDFASENIKIDFVPHLIPMVRGILATIYVELSNDLKIDNVLKLFTSFYKDEYFVNILDNGNYPETRFVKASNFVQIAIEKTPTGKLVIIATIDNLVKGAAGQAIQNMNLMLDFDETTGLKQVATIL